MNEKITKVAFVGTSCVGKTSLLDMCKNRMEKQALTVSEVAREYFTAHPKVQDRFSVATQGDVQKLILDKEQFAHQWAPCLGRTAIICDRSVLDAPVYVASQGDHEGAEELFKRARHWTPTYDKIYLLDPADVSFANDDVRNEDEAARQLFHDSFVEFFARHGVGYELLSGTIEERFDTVEHYLAGTP